MVADRLGYTCWNRELVGAIATQLGVEPALVTAVDGRGHAPGDDSAAPSGPDRLGRADYVRGLREVAQAIVRRGSAVIVGRGVAFLLDPADCLRVRVVCPIEARIAGLATRSQLSLESARATVEYVDRERRAFVRELHGRDVEDASCYDLVVSTAELSLEGATDIIVAAYHARFDLRRWPRSTMRPSDVHAHR